MFVHLVHPYQLEANPVGASFLHPAQRLQEAVGADEGPVREEEVDEGARGLLEDIR
jgi:hypothetical protein